MRLSVFFCLAFVLSLLLSSILILVSIWNGGHTETVKDYTKTDMHEAIM